MFSSTCEKATLHPFRSERLTGSRFNQAAGKLKNQ